VERGTPGKIGLGAGLTSGIEPFLEPFDIPPLSGVVLDFVGSLPPPAFWAFGAAAGVRLLLIPRRPRFIMLAGVTGVIGDVPSRKLGTAEFGGDGRGTGGAGGGIDKSTGDGESVSKIVLFLRVLVERRSGVLLALLACLMDCLPVDIEATVVGGPRFRVVRIASSALGDAVRLFDGLWVWYASSQGLVKGEMSMSRAGGEGSGIEGLVCWNTMLAGAELDPG